MQRRGYPPNNRYYDRYPSYADDLGDAIAAMSDRLENLRETVSKQNEDISNMRVMMERVISTAEAQRERERHQDEAIKKVEDSIEPLKGCPERLSRLEATPTRLAPWVAILVSIVLPFIIILASKVP